MKLHVLIFIFTLSLSINAHAANGIKAKVQLKVFEGSEIMMHERNLSMIQECTVGFLKDASIGISECDIDLVNIDRSKKSGQFILAMNNFNETEALFNISALAHGYMGGGQDGPSFGTHLKLSVHQTEEYFLNLGFYSRTPEIAQDYLVRVELLEIKSCNSVDECSNF